MLKCVCLTHAQVSLLCNALTFCSGLLPSCYSVKLLSRHTLLCIANALVIYLVLKPKSAYFASIGHCMVLYQDMASENLLLYLNYPVSNTLLYCPALLLFNLDRYYYTSYFLVLCLKDPMDSQRTCYTYFWSWSKSQGKGDDEQTGNLYLMSVYTCHIYFLLLH